MRISVKGLIEGKFGFLVTKSTAKTSVALEEAFQSLTKITQVGLVKSLV